MWTLALGLTTWAVWLWPSVPDTIPLHFGLDGMPDRWGDRSLGAWLTIPLLGLAVAAVLEVAATWAIRNPDAPALNLPNKQAMMDLPLERRIPVLRQVAGMLYATGVFSLVAFVLIQIGTWTSAMGDDGSGWVLTGGLGLAAGSLLVLVWGLVRVEGEIKRQQKAASSRPDSASTVRHPPSAGAATSLEGDFRT